MKKTNDTPMEDFQALYNRQVNRVYRLALVMLGSQSDAEDMVQMVFLKVWEKKISFRDTDHETAWILTATKNQCKDVLKSYERKHCGTLEEMPEPGIASKTIWKMLCGWHWSRWNQNTGFCCICIIMKAIPYGN